MDFEMNIALDHVDGPNKITKTFVGGKVRATCL
jgi:hypothetical protein